MSLSDTQFVVMVYAVGFGLCFVGGAIAIAIMFRKDPARAVDALRTFYNDGNGLRILTVLTVVATAGMLGFAEKFTDGIVSLLSGVAGFVLGGIATRKKPLRIDGTQSIANEELRAERNP